MSIYDFSRDREIRQRKGKAVFVRSSRDSWGCETIGLTDGGEVSLQEGFRVLISVRRWVEPQGQ
jgi:hypothetical protein